MEITSKELREVEFRERLRGYDTTEVDEFLERVAVAVDELNVKLRQLSDRAERQSRERDMSSSADDDEALRRTLVLAQRAADMAIREAQEEASGLVDAARSEADAVLSQAQESARRTSNEAQRQLQDDIGMLKSNRDQLRSDVRTLADMLDTERARLSEALNGALGWIENSLGTSPELNSLRTAPLSSEGPDAGDDVEQQIEEDAQVARPAETRTRAAQIDARPEDDLPPPPDSSDLVGRAGGGALGLVRAEARAGNSSRRSATVERDTEMYRVEDAHGEDWLG